MLSQMSLSIWITHKMMLSMSVNVMKELNNDASSILDTYKKCQGQLVIKFGWK